MVFGVASSQAWTGITWGVLRWNSVTSRNYIIAIQSAHRWYALDFTTVHLKISAGMAFVCRHSPPRRTRVSKAEERANFSGTVIICQVIRWGASGVEIAMRCVARSSVRHWRLAGRLPPAAPALRRAAALARAWPWHWTWQWAGARGGRGRAGPAPAGGWMHRQLHRPSPAVLPSSPLPEPTCTMLNFDLRTKQDAPYAYRFKRLMYLFLYRCRSVTIRPIYFTEAFEIGGTHDSIIGRDIKLTNCTGQIFKMISFCRCLKFLDICP